MRAAHHARPSTGSLAGCISSPWHAMAREPPHCRPGISPFRCLSPLACFRYACNRMERVPLRATVCSSERDPAVSSRLSAAHSVAQLLNIEARNGCAEVASERLHRAGVVAPLRLAPSFPGIKERGALHRFARPHCASLADEGANRASEVFEVLDCFHRRFGLLEAATLAQTFPAFYGPIEDAGQFS